MQQRPHFGPSPVWFLVPILVVALGLRIFGLDWDGLSHFHPDERYITWVGSTIEFTGHDRPADVLDTQQSQFNPFYWPAEETTAGIVVPFDQPRNFAYGHLPLYLGVAFTRLLETVAGELLIDAWPLEFDRLTVASRLLTALTDVAAIVLVYRIGRRLFDPWVGVAAAAFLAVTVMHIQLARFFIADTFLTFFVLLTLDRLTSAVAAPDSNRQNFRVAGAAVAAGLAIGSKFSAVVLGFPFLITLILLNGRRFWGTALWTTLLIVLTFALTNPFAIIDFSCPPEAVEIAGQPVTVTHCYLQNVGRESTMVRGSLAFPFVRQYDGTQPIIYPLLNQLNWGLGWPLGLVSFGGLIVACVGYLGRFLRRAANKKEFGVGVVLAWMIPYLLITGTFQVKFMRYWQPLLPLLVVFGGWLLLRGLPARWRAAGIGRAAAVAVWLLTALYAFAFVGLYRQPHPWITASIWLYENAPRESIVAVELWDETLPADLTGRNPAWHPSRFVQLELNWLSRPYERDDEAKLMANLEMIAAADYWIVASNRSYGVVSRLENAYPLSHRVYPKLFDGSLGYELSTSASRSLTVGPFNVLADRFGPAEVQPPPLLVSQFQRSGTWIGPAVDESFTVYDQPLAMVFVNRERLSAAELRHIIGP